MEKQSVVVLIPTLASESGLCITSGWALVMASSGVIIPIFLPLDREPIPNFMAHSKHYTFTLPLLKAEITQE